MISLLHVSDLHFGPPFHEGVGRALQAFAHRLGPDCIVASGDFTQRAKEEQFAAARAFLNEFPKVPIVVTPGNHDVPLMRIAERVLDPYKHYRRHINEALDTITDIPGARIVALNSTAPLKATVNGRIHQWQIDYAREAFAAVTDEKTLRIIVAHHHFAPPPDFESADPMPNARRALDAFTDMRVDLILGGHLHRAYIGNSLDVYAGADREHGIVIAQSGTSTSRRGRAREREKNSLNVLRLTPTGIRVTHYMYFEDAGDFVPTSRHIFFRRGRPPLEGAGEDGAIWMDESRETNDGV
ncbi:metallophosphoesterase family protein [Longimicrobium terrae]|uniref:3',5'-cyclic AMP phosphodiesterase CpdA n=1 Tax=Longimicrobium terrae TaxID=1639882 RepID=A0A841H3N4_9BACT|nr:metallophosphoesterase [Longimicrobium terrae]MBB4638057.1 3',5'-cyclic AMP phosphodiesterase CpdA [Longimicrobium terrae]MBB6072429.1 3',5'-cyclic AMP phosphodiesterase CpdA [Longimicrobium terrae]NNC32157.1 3',5'-cyclic-nucleotide phosphodiesterase [Longimicrobium terrae]